MQAKYIQAKSTPIVSSDLFELLPRFLLQWYEVNARTLPWRENTDPYRVWVSEIMLQQTRVSAVIPYYNRFMERLPSIADLAAAEEAGLLKLWEGLGYYSRAKNLQKAAKIICAEYDGKMPADFELLKKLPGIGEYTAGAIASIAFSLPVPAVDGNVLRIMSRLKADSQDMTTVKAKKEYGQVIQGIIPKDRTGDFNQALMELGALICLPNAAPLCEQCPAASVCAAHLQGNETDYPVMPAKKARRQEKITVLLVEQNRRILLCKRENKGLLAGLWQYLVLPEALEQPEISKWCEENKIILQSIQPLPQARHIFTHVQWNMQGYYLKAAGCPDESFGDHVWADKNSLLVQYAVPSAFKTYTEFWLKHLS